MTIDWSKAPEDATHFSPAFERFDDLWAKTDGHRWMYRALDASAWHYGPHPCESESFIRRPWKGEGLPPVGAVCEFAGFNPEETTFDDPSVGDTVTVIAHYLSGCVQVAAFTYNCAANFGALNVAQGAHGCFRPIRTAEQIAAEERDRAINEMVFCACGCEPDGGNTSAFMICGYLYDSGYRKQESSQ